MLSRVLVVLSALACARAVDLVVPVWPTDVIPYNFSEGVPAELTRKIEAQMRAVEAASCFTFVEYDGSNAPDGYVEFSRMVFLNVCGVRQSSNEPNDVKVSIALNYRYCMKGTIGDTEILRLVMYALGFVNEIQRSDRDKYIFIAHSENPFGPGEHRDAVNSRKLSDGQMPWQNTQDTAYDFTSVMHPDSDFMSGCPWFFKLDGYAVKGDQNRGLSSIDRQRLRNMCSEF